LTKKSRCPQGIAGIRTLLNFGTQETTTLAITVTSFLHLLLKILAVSLSLGFSDFFVAICPNPLYDYYSIGNYSRPLVLSFSLRPPVPPHE